jgi:DNA-binding CsgD family transcriptional regulator
MSSANPANAGTTPEQQASIDPTQALSAITQLHQAKDAPQLLEALMTATREIGATASIYSIAIPENGTESSSFTLFACHPGFAQRQYRLGSLLDHPWFRCARSHHAPTTDQQVQPGNASESEALELAREYGFSSCLIVPTPSSIDLERIEMLCLGSTRAAFFEGDDARIIRALARALAAELHDWITTNLSASLCETAGLHEADIELLKLEWQGLGTKEISARTGMSPASVDSRFQRLNARLDCPNRKASARRAAAYGLLEAN